jgi:hypothetical protein
VVFSREGGLCAEDLPTLSVRSTAIADELDLQASPPVPSADGAAAIVLCATTVLSTPRARSSWPWP